MSETAFVTRFPHLADADERAVRWITMAYLESRSLEERVGYLRGLEACKLDMGDYAIARSLRVFVDHLEQSTWLGDVPAGQSNGPSEAAAAAQAEDTDVAPAGPRYCYSRDEEIYSVDFEAVVDEAWVRARMKYDIGDAPDEGEAVTIYRGVLRPIAVSDVAPDLLDHIADELAGEVGSELAAKQNFPSNLQHEFEIWLASKLGGALTVFRVEDATEITVTCRDGEWHEPDEDDAE